MNSTDRRRTRQITLFLAAILIPMAVLITLTMRVARQDRELAEKRVSDERREALEQLRRELAAKLEAIKLQELNRVSDNPDSPVVFAAPLDQGRLALPWNKSQRSNAGAQPGAFATYQQEGEAREFLGNDFPGALDAYGEALKAARVPSDQCAAKLSQSRVLIKLERKPDAAAAYRAMLADCDAAEDAEGMAFALYAAERLITLDLDAPAAQQYLLRRAQSPRRLAPVQLYLMRSLLHEAPAVLSERIHEVEQMLALSNDLGRLARVDFPFHVSPGKSVWLAYGDEPWLVTVTSKASFEPPLVMAISSKKISPPGVTLLASKSGESLPLGESFVDLEVEWPPNRFTPSLTIPPILYTAGIGLIFAVAMLSGYLVLRDVSREIQLAEMRSHFVASVSHELKTPLTAIRMFAETLAMGRGQDERTRTEYLQTVVNESERLSRLVDNVLDFSRIERGDKTYRMLPASLPDVVRAAAKAMQYPLTQQGFVLNVSIDDNVPVATADADALQQAVLNLLANAMKYSGEAREIDLCLQHVKGEALIKVIDRGIGIAAEDQSKIFEKFYRVRSKHSEVVPGTGLGLTLATHIVNAHGGRLEVVSSLGRGSTFTIRIPLADGEIRV